MNLASAVLWIVLAGGAVPALWFLWMFRPSWPPASPAGGMSVVVGIVALLYVRSALVLALRGWTTSFQGFADAAISVGLGLICDAGLIWLAVTFRKFRAAYRERMSRESRGDSREEE